LSIFSLFKEFGISDIWRKENGESLGVVHDYACDDGSDDRDLADLCCERGDGLRDIPKAVQTRHGVGARYDAGHHDLRIVPRAGSTGLHHRVYDGGVLQRCMERKSKQQLTLNEVTK